MPSVVDHQNQIVYLKCSSAITAMGIPALVKSLKIKKLNKKVLGEFVGLIA